VAAIAAVMLMAPAAPAGAADARVALVLSSRLGPFTQAAGAIEEELKQSRLQPEVVTYDLDGSQDNAPAVIERIRAAHPALILPVGTLATEVVLSANLPIPVVFSMVLYPAQSGFLNRPGREVTGSSLDIPLETQFRALRRLVPAAKRVGVLYSPKETGALIDTARQVAARVDLELDAREVERPERAPSLFDMLLRDVDAVWTVADSHVFTAETTAALILAALRARVPFFGLSTAQVRSGALAALSNDYTDNGKQAAELALRVLGGERAGAIPATPARNATLNLNLRTAQHLGLSVDPEVEREATVVIR